MSLRLAFKEDYSVIIDTGWYNSPAILAINHDQKWYKCWRNKTKEWFEEKYVFPWKDRDWSRKQSQSWLGLDSSHNAGRCTSFEADGEIFLSFLRRIRSIPTHSILVLPPELLKCFDPSPPPHLLPFRLHHNRDLIQNLNLTSCLHQWARQKQPITKIKRIQRGKRNKKQYVNLNSHRDGCLKKKKTHTHTKKIRYIK